MVKITIFDGLIIDRLPLLAEESVIKVNLSATDEIIAEETVVVVGPDFQGRGTWEVHLKLITLVELWTCIIHLVVLLLVEFLGTALDNEEWVRLGEKVLLGEVEALKNVATHFACY